MVTTYDYPYSTTFVAGVDPDKLHYQIDSDPGIPATFTGLNVRPDPSEDKCGAIFSAAITAGEETTLDNLMAAHDPRLPRVVVGDTEVFHGESDLEVDATGGNINVTLPRADQNQGRRTEVKRLSSDTSGNTVTAIKDPETSDTIESATILAGENAGFYADTPSSWVRF